MVEENTLADMDHPYIGWSRDLHGYLLLIGLELQSQNLKSVLFVSFCGHYCVYFVLFRCRGVLCMLLYLILRQT